MTTTAVAACSVPCRPDALAAARPRPPAAGPSAPSPSPSLDLPRPWSAFHGRAAALETFHASSIDSDSTLDGDAMIPLDRADAPGAAAPAGAALTTMPPSAAAPPLSASSPSSPPSSSLSPSPRAPWGAAAATKRPSRRTRRPLPRPWPRDVSASASDGSDEAPDGPRRRPPPRRGVPARSPSPAPSLSASSDAASSAPTLRNAPRLARVRDAAGDPVDEETDESALRDHDTSNDSSATAVAPQDAASGDGRHPRRAALPASPASGHAPTSSSSSSSSSHGPPNVPHLPLEHDWATIQAIASAPTTADLLAFWGYPCETHHVLTASGHTLLLYRIPHAPHNAPPRSAATPRRRRRRHRRASCPDPERDLEDPDDVDGHNDDRGDGGDGACDVGSEDDGEADAAGGRPPVVLWHGLANRSCTFVCNNIRSHNLALVLADAGYDVWLPNTRMHRLARCFRGPGGDNGAAAWDWDIEDLATDDFPAVLEYIRIVTQWERVTYLGYSQGACLALMGLALKPELNNSLRCCVALAAALKPQPSCSRIINTFLHVARPGRVYSLVPGRGGFMLVSEWLEASCHAFVMVVLMSLTFLTFFAWTGSRWRPFHRRAAFMTHTFGANSTRGVVHWLQIIAAQRFIPYQPTRGGWPTSLVRLVRRLPVVGRAAPSDSLSDAAGAQDGPERERIAHAPEYDLSAITAPLWVAMSRTDPMSDVDWTRARLPPHAQYHLLEGYEHMDILWADDAPRDVFRPLLAYLAAQHVDVAHRLGRPQAASHGGKAGGAKRGGAHGAAASVLATGDLASPSSEPWPWPALGTRARPHPARLSRRAHHHRSVHA